MVFSKDKNQNLFYFLLYLSLRTSGQQGEAISFNYSHSILLKTEN